MPKDRGETLLFTDGANGALVGYATWRFRRLRVREGEPKRHVAQVHYMGIDRVYQHRPAAGGGSVATRVFATVEREILDHGGHKDAMPFVIEVEVGNEHARAVYVHWGFEHARFETSKTGRSYERLWRPPPADN